MKRILLLATGGVVALVVLAWLPWGRSFTYTVQLAAPAHEAAARSVIEELERERLFGALPLVHVAWFPRARLSQRLADALPAYHSIQVERTGLRHIHIHGTLRTPFARWCRAQPLHATSTAEFLFLTQPLPVQECVGFVGAQEGRVYTLPPQAEPDLPDMLWVSTDEAMPQRALSPHAFAALRALVRWLETHGAPVVRIEETGLGIAVRLHGGGSLVLGTRGDWTDIPSYLQALVHEGVLLSAREGSGSLGDALRSVRYIDFRFFPRVFIGKRER